MIRVTIRIPDEQAHLHEVVSKTAQSNHRSLNGEILHALEFYLHNAPEAKQAKPMQKEVLKKKSPK